MARHKAKYLVKFEHSLRIEYANRDSTVDCKAWLSSDGTIVLYRVYLREPYKGREFTPNSLRDDQAIMFKARELYLVKDYEIVDATLDFSESDTEHDLRKKDLINSASYVRQTDRKPKSTSSVQKSVIEQDNQSSTEDKSAFDEIDETEETESSEVETVIDIRSATTKIADNSPKPTSKALNKKTTILEQNKESIINLIRNNDGQLTVQNISLQLKLAERYVADIVKVIGVQRTIDPTYHGKGRRYLLTLASPKQPESDFEPQSLTKS